MGHSSTCQHSLGLVLCILPNLCLLCLYILRLLLRLLFRLPLIFLCLWLFLLFLLGFRLFWVRLFLLGLLVACGFLLGIGDSLLVLSRGASLAAIGTSVVCIISDCNLV